VTWAAMPTVGDCSRLRSSLVQSDWGRAGLKVQKETGRPKTPLSLDFLRDNF
jgi:L,D-peptidoglycan transpeptidase YkuD (ErfK/YbiS/YcfS/YnhG family)